MQFVVPNVVLVLYVAAMQPTEHASIARITKILFM
jgi:hypothetical protein